MLKDYMPVEHSTVEEYELVFDDGHNNGFGFPCDKDGKLLESEDKNPAAHRNYQECLKHPERFVRFNRIVRTERRVRENAHGICVCGEEVELWNQYMGACECPNCGRWYNLFGEELNPPELWEEDLSEDDPW